MKRFLMIAAAVALAGCAAPEGRGLDGVADTTAKFEAAFNTQDADALMALYTPDAMVLAPNFKRIEGRQAIRSLWQNFFDAGVRDMDLNTIELTVYENRASEVGTFSLTGPDGRGGRVTSTGKYIVLWQKDRNGWRLHRDIWNNDPKG